MSDEREPHIDLSGFPTNGLPEYLDPSKPESGIIILSGNESSGPWARRIDTPKQQQEVYKRGELLKELAIKLRQQQLPTYEEVAAVVDVETLRAKYNDPILREFEGQATQYNNPDDQPVNHYERVWRLTDSGNYEDHLWIPEMIPPDIAEPQEVYNTVYLKQEMEI